MRSCVGCSFVSTLSSCDAKILSISVLDITFASTSVSILHLMGSFSCQRVCRYLSASCENFNVMTLSIFYTVYSDPRNISSVGLLSCFLCVLAIRGLAFFYNNFAKMATFMTVVATGNASWTLFSSSVGDSLPHLLRIRNLSFFGFLAGLLSLWPFAVVWDRVFLFMMMQFRLSYLLTVALWLSFGTSNFSGLFQY